MNRNQRIALVVAAVVVAASAFVIASPGGDGDDSNRAPRTTSSRGADETATPETPAAPGITRIAIRGGEVVGGPKKVTVTKGDRVRIVVTADERDDMHLHGYDIEKEVEPGKPARFSL